MNKKSYTTITTTILAILVFIFYWYELRPSNIRENCSGEALESAVLSTQDYESLDSVKRQDKQNELIDQFYQNCIKSKGLEK